MIRYSIVLGLLMLCTTVIAQDWVEHGGAEYNCSVLGGILAEFGDSDLSRSDGRAMTVAELFAMMFPSCPAPADTISSDASTNIDARSSDALYTFSSDEAGMQPALGPLTLSVGVYVFTASADAGMSVSPTIVSGDCGTDLELGSIIFFTSNGRTQTEQSAIEVEEDCNTLLEISNFGSDAWTLSILKVEAIESESQTAYTFDSSELGLQPVLGPLRLERGLYVVTASSDAGMSVTPQVLSGECGLDLELGSIIFFTSDGETQVEQSAIEVEADCDILLEVSNFGGTIWSVAIEKLS